MDAYNSLCSYSTRVDKVITTKNIVKMRDEKEYLKPKSNALIKWWIPLVCYNYDVDGSKIW
jgi:hypothetical protein